MIDQELDELRFRMSHPFPDQCGVKSLFRFYKINFDYITQDPGSAQYGGTDFTINVSVNSSVEDNVTVYLWTSDSTSGPWTLSNQTIWDNATGGFQDFNSTLQFDCGNVGTVYTVCA